MKDAIGHKDIVAELYRGLLNREPDPVGYADAVNALDSGSMTLSQYVKHITSSDEFAQVVAASSWHSRRFTNDVTQHGEVWYLLRVWVNEYSLNRIVVDVGARGRDRSNSYDLMRHFGWQGLLVEANPSLVDSIKEEFCGTNFGIVSCAISDYEGKANFTRGINDDVSSLSAEQSRSWGATRGDFEVEVRRLSSVLKENEIPYDFDLLSLDIEGEDLRVLNDLVGSSAYRPRWILIETGETNEIGDRPFSVKVQECYSYQGCIGPNTVLRLRDR